MQWRVARGSIHLHRIRLMPCQEIFCMKLEQPGLFGFLFGHTQGRKTVWIDPLVLARVTISYRGTFLFKELPYWVSQTISFLNVLYFFFQSFNINFRIYSWTKINRHKYWSRGIGFCAKNDAYCQLLLLVRPQHFDQHFHLFSSLFFKIDYSATGFSTTHHHFHTHSMRKSAEHGIGVGTKT